MFSKSADGGKGVSLAVMFSGAFLSAFCQTAVTPALPVFMADFSVDASVVQWVTTGFFLVSAIMISVTAHLTDRYDMRRLFMVAMAIYLVGSFIIGVAPAFEVLLAGRLMQAVSVGVLMPMTMTALLLAYPPEQRSTAMGMFGLINAFAPGISPCLSGVVIDWAGWRVLFLALAAFSLAIMVIGAGTLKRSEPLGIQAPLDKPSLALSCVGLGCLLYGLSALGNGRFGVIDGVVFLMGIIGIALFVRRQLRMEHPMLEMRVFTVRRFTIGVIIGMLVQASLFVAHVLLPIYLQAYRGYSASVSGLVILPGALLLGVLSPTTGKLADKYGVRNLALFGMVLLVLSTAALGFLREDTPIQYVAFLFAVRMVALAVMNMPVTAWAMKALDDGVVNHGTSLNNTMRQIAGSFGTALLVSVATLSSSAGGASMGAVRAGVLGIDVAFRAAALCCLAGLILIIVFVGTAKSEAVTKR
ncbi:DHA2 family efflux MFS transporter permease subunit [Gordonibacter sp.]|uniref:DHA2 family efflux MFS transporter permease subunit n=1 Tax=Gordonibacter sp. TaxID=1968902 RepID=UPI002FCC4DB1